MLDTNPQINPLFNATRATLETTVADFRRTRNIHGERLVVLENLADVATARSRDEFASDPEAVPNEEDFVNSRDFADPEDTLLEPTLGVYQPFFDGLPTGILTTAQINCLDFRRLGAASDPFKGLVAAIDDIGSTTSQADDLIDLGFSRLQAEIYRIRQIMLDNEEATKLATFPILAGIAKGSNAVALNEGLKAHFTAKKAVDSGREAASETTTSEPVLRFLAQPATFQPVLMLQPQPTALPTLRQSTAITSFQIQPTQFMFNKIDVASVTAAQTQTNLLKDIVNQTQQSVVDDLVLATSADKRRGILGAEPLVGDIRDIRSMTIADRLAVSAAVTALNAAAMSSVKD